MIAQKLLGNKKTIIILTAICLLVGVLLFFHFLPKYDLPGKNLSPDLANESLLLVGESFLEASGESSLMLFIDPNDWSIDIVDLNTFPNFHAAGILDARPFLLNGEQKWAVATSGPGKMLILGRSGHSWPDLKIEFEEESPDTYVRAIFVGDITGDGKEEIVTGTRPSGILRYYTFVNGQWSGRTIDKLGIDERGSAIHDLLIADLNKNGLNEILLTTHIPIYQLTGKEDELPKSKPKIIRYEFNQKQNTWSKEVLWEFTTTKLFGPGQLQKFAQKLGGPPKTGSLDVYYQHGRYLFFDDFAGDDAKEIVSNLRGGKQKLLVLNQQKTGSWQTMGIIENELSLNRQTIATGDIDNNGKSEILSTTVTDDALLLYAYKQGAWKRTIIAKDLTGGANEGESVQAIIILNSSTKKYKKILYVVSGLHANTTRFFLLSYTPSKDVWEKELVAELDIGIHAWHISPTFP